MAYIVIVGSVGSQCFYASECSRCPERCLAGQKAATPYTCTCVHMHVRATHTGTNMTGGRGGGLARHRTMKEMAVESLWPSSSYGRQVVMAVEQFWPSSRYGRRAVLAVESLWLSSSYGSQQVGGANSPANCSSERERRHLLHRKQPHTRRILDLRCQALAHPAHIFILVV